MSLQRWVSKSRAYFFGLFLILGFLYLTATNFDQHQASTVTRLVLKLQLNFSCFRSSEISEVPDTRLMKRKWS